MIRCLLICIFAVALSSLSVADTVNILPAGGPVDAHALPYQNVTIKGIDNNLIRFTTDAGTDVQKDMADVASFTVDDEPTFTQAQNDFSLNHFAKATDEYDQTIQKTGKSWLKTYCLPRLVQAADKAGRLDTATKAYIQLVQSQPDSPAQTRPSVHADSEDAQNLQSAQEALDSALRNTDLKNPQRLALIRLELDILNLGKDSAKRAEVEKMYQDAGGSTTEPASATAYMADARDALQNKKYQQALEAIGKSAKSGFADAGQQGDALYIVAQAKAGLADSANDPTARRDAAIAYLRVAADFKNTPGAPHVTDSLLAAAAILEKLSEPQEAAQVYQSIAQDYPNTPAAVEAQNDIQRLKGSLR